MTRNDTVDGVGDVTPHIVKSRRAHPADNIRNHVERGMHLVTYGANAGACMCTMACCYNADAGCICKSCSGAGHYGCISVNAKRSVARAARARTVSAAATAIANANAAIANVNANVNVNAANGSSDSDSDGSDSDV